jgi:hypothetical protein
MIKKIIGYSIIILLWGGIFTATTVSAGVVVALLGFGITALIIGLIILASYLIS